MLRRSRADISEDQETGYALQGFLMHLDGRRLLNSAGVRVVLTGSEFEILRALVENAGRVLSREQLRAKAALSAGSMDRSVDIIVSQAAAQNRTRSARAGSDPDRALDRLCVRAEREGAMKFLLPRRITAQIALVLVLCVVLFHAAVSVILFSFGTRHPPHAFDDALSAIVALDAVPAAQRTEVGSQFTALFPDLHLILARSVAIPSRPAHSAPPPRPCETGFPRQSASTSRQQDRGTKGTACCSRH